MTDQLSTPPVETSAEPVLLTPRLRLRPLRDNDIAPLATLNRDPDVMRYIGDGQPMAPEAVRRYLHRMVSHWRTEGFGRWAIEPRTQGEPWGEFIGFTGLRRLIEYPAYEGEIEAAWRIRRDRWGQGLASEAARAALRDGFSRADTERIFATVDPDNIASRKVMEKLGFHSYGEQTSPEGRHLLVYVLSRSELS